MAAELKGRITIDADSVDQATEKTRRFGEVIENFFKRQTGAGRRAELAIGASIRDLLSGDILGAVEGLLGRVTGLGLVGGTAIAAVGTALIKGYKELEAFNKELESTGKLLAKMPEAAANVEVLKKHVDDLMASIKPKETGSPGFLANVVDTLKSGFSTTSTSAQAQGLSQHKNKIDEIVRALSEQREKTVAVTDAQRQEAALAEKIAAIHQAQSALLADIIAKHLTAAETQKLIHQVNMTAIAEEKRARLEALAAAEKEVQKKTGISTQELVEAGRLAPNQGFQIRHRQSFPVALQGDAYLLGISQRMEAEGERLRSLGLREAAGMYFGQAADIKQGLDSLKPEEKEAAVAFKSALDSSDKLKEAVRLLDQINGKLPQDMTNK